MASVVMIYRPYPTLGYKPLAIASVNRVKESLRKIQRDGVELTTIRVSRPDEAPDVLNDSTGAEILYLT